jgi:glycosyltransferase involved in cell wall biosynthesis
MIQEANGIQIVCINDGSTDQSLSILEEYKAKNESLVIVSQKNQGLSVARNTGILNADGKFILFLDSDDMLAPSALKEIYDQLENNDLDMLLYDADCTYETEILKINAYKDNYYHRKKSYGGPKEGKLIFAEQIENDDLCDSACLMALNREWLRRESLFFLPGILHEDCLFTFKCFMRAQKVMHINRSLMVYRVREHSIMTSTQSYGNLKGRLVCYLEILKYLVNHDLPPRIADAIRKFDEIIMYNLKKVDSQLTIEERRKTTCFNPVEKLLSASMQIGMHGSRSNSSRLLLLGLAALIQESKAVVVYGAGEIGKRVYDFLKENKLQDKIIAFVVSSGASGKYIGGIPVFNMDEYPFSKEVLLLIAANTFFQDSMLLTAHLRGFHDIEVVTGELEGALREHQNVIA